MLEPEPEIEPEKEVFISYVWGGESEEIADELDKAFQEKEILIVRDKRDTVEMHRESRFTALIDAVVDKLAK